jgi:hypothetical protein
MRWLVLLVQGGISIWLIFLAFWVWLAQFNKYNDLNIIDCDTDAEAVLTICLVLLWSTTLLIWIVNLIFKYRYNDKSLCFVSILSAFLSIALAPKAIELMNYSAELSGKCP